MRPNSLGTRPLGSVPILRTMPGPWGVAIRLLRAKKGWSQIKLAQKAQISQNTLGSVERGHHTLTSILQKIADELEVPIEAVLVPDGKSGFGSELDALLRRIVRQDVQELIGAPQQSPQELLMQGVDAMIAETEQKAQTPKAGKLIRDGKPTGLKRKK